jgi:hypothetical protein
MIISAHPGVRCLCQLRPSQASQYLQAYLKRWAFKGGATRRKLFGINKPLNICVDLPCVYRLGQFLFLVFSIYTAKSVQFLAS